MKQIKLVILFSFIFSTILTGCPSIINRLFDYSYAKKYTDWQIVSISGVGSFRLPSDWIVTQRENVVYITDRPLEEEVYKIYLIGGRRGGGEYIRYNDFFDNIDIKYIETVRGTGYSNSAQYSITKFNINGNIEEKYDLYFHNSDKTIDLLAWDSLIDEKTIIKIAQSYRMYL